MAVESHDKSLDDLLKMVETGKAQLPEFQRSWVWDDTKICKLIESITSGYPMGAAMFLANGGDSIRFKYRRFTGVSDSVSAAPDWLVLDGQQRLTTLFQVFKCKTPVITRLDTNRDKTIQRYYYLDIKKCLDPESDRLDAIVSVSEKKLQTTDIGRTVTLDLSTRDKEYENLMFPLNIVFNNSDVMKWMMGLFSAYPNDMEIQKTYMSFYEQIIGPILQYKMPVIELDKSTPKEAVCQIFENVNTGGVPLTVFELITATFAADEYDLRADWHSIKQSFEDKKLEALRDITGANFLAAMTLLVSYKKSLVGNGAVTCKKRDILRLDLEDYKANHDALVGGFESAASFLVHQGIYRNNDLPYSSQLIPLAAIFAFDNEKKDNRAFLLGHNRDLLAKWYWCGVLGELYGGANEARFALDIANIFEWIKGGNQPDTVARSNFQPTRLLSMQTRNSAAYKGVMALIMQDSPLDFMSGEKMSVATYLDEDTDIHHIFPEAYCSSIKLPREKWNSVVNKTPIYASSNRSIGGRAPSKYIKTMFEKGLDTDKVVAAISSHKVNYEYLSEDKFDEYFIDRAIRLLDRIEKATGKTIAGRDSEETIKEFGQPLVVKEGQEITTPVSSPESQSNNELNDRFNYASLVELCKEYKEDIKARKTLSNVLDGKKVRYIDQNGNWGYTQFGDFYFTSMGVMMLITTDKTLTWFHQPDEMWGTLFSTVPVFYAGVQTGFSDDCGREIYTGDVVRLTRSPMEFTLMVRHFKGYQFPGLAADNHEILFEEGDEFHIVGNVFYDLLAEHLEVYDLDYYTGHNSVFLYPFDKEVVDEAVEKMSKAPSFKIPPQKVETYPWAHDPIMKAYQFKKSDKFVYFHEKLELEYDPEDPGTWPEVYADFIPAVAREQDFDGFVTLGIDLSNPNLNSIKQQVDDLFFQAHNHPTQTYVILDYEEKIGDKKVSKAIDELFRPVKDYSLHNIVLPFRVFTSL